MRIRKHSQTLLVDVDDRASVKRARVGRGLHVGANGGTVAAAVAGDVGKVDRFPARTTDSRTAAARVNGTVRRVQDVLDFVAEAVLERARLADLQLVGGSAHSLDAEADFHSVGILVETGGFACWVVGIRAGGKVFAGRRGTADDALLVVGAKLQSVPGRLVGGSTAITAVATAVFGNLHVLGVIAGSRSFTAVFVPAVAFVAGASVVASVTANAAGAFTGRLTTTPTSPLTVGVAGPVFCSGLAANSAVLRLGLAGSALGLDRAGAPGGPGAGGKAGLGLCVSPGVQTPCPWQVDQV